ncbi:DUF7873 family protein [Plantactinospora sonchi]|uniref:Uncharacterized protein n=1 Tax=Plantactinospora sonchi TaxID=1544735 RepID=A0ABU7S4X1_9ACTN
MPDQTALHKINALVQSFKPQAKRELTEAHRRTQKAPPLSGISRTYQPFADDIREHLPPESTRVQYTVREVLDEVATTMGRLFDLQFLQDVGNSQATADVVVDGQPLVRDAPVTYLLFLEKQLVDLRTFVDGLAVLDAAEKWEFDPDRGCYASAPSQTQKMRKVHRNHVKAEATEKHPAQVEVYTEDVPVGTWTTVKLSGALPAERVKQLRGRVDKLLEAVKVAREEANSATVGDRKVGDQIFGYLFG